MWIVFLACLAGDSPASPLPKAPETAPASEHRGVWVTRWTWESEAQVVKGMAEIAQTGFTAVYFQARGTFDAFYASPREPWSALLTGTLGQDPGWDPLQVALREAHAHDLELHAWINTFPLWRGEEAPSDPTHAWNAHPDWRLELDGQDMALNPRYVFADPANAQVRARIVEVVQDLEAAGVDGVHLDYVRYPGPAYGAGSAEHKRAQVEAVVQAAQEALTVPLSAAVWGIQENHWGWTGVSQGKVDYHQDSVALAAHLQAAIPMIYWRVDPGGRLDFETLNGWFQAQPGTWRPGISADALSTQDALACIEVARAQGADGFVLFEWRAVREDREAYQAALKGL